MKKVTAVILILFLVSSLCACTKANESAASTPTPETETSAAETPQAEVMPEILDIQIEDYEAVGSPRTSMTFKFKIRNISGRHLDIVNLYFQVMDMNGDVISNSSAFITDLDADQGGWTNSSGIVNAPKEEIGSIRIREYNVGTHMPGKTNQFTTDYGIEFPEPIRLAVNEKLQKLEGTGAFSSGLSADEITSLITTHVWTRNLPDSSDTATLTFLSDGTGNLSITNGDRFELTWEVKDLQIEVAMMVPGGVGYGAYDIAATEGGYSLTQTDDTSFVYIMN